MTMHKTANALQVKLTSLNVERTLRAHNLQISQTSKVASAVTELRTERK